MPPSIGTESEGERSGPAGAVQPGPGVGATLESVALPIHEHIWSFEKIRTVTHLAPSNRSYLAFAPLLGVLFRNFSCTLDVLELRRGVGARQKRIKGATPHAVSADIIPGVRLMRVRYQAFTFFTVLAFWIAPARAECPTLSLPDEFTRSESVFLGRAVGQSVISRPSSERGVDRLTTFEVEEVWKGKVEKTERVRTCGGVVGDVDFGCAEAFRFEVGSRYVVFAEGKPLSTDICHHTSMTDRAATTLEWLSTKPSKKTQPPAK